MAKKDVQIFFKPNLETTEVDIVFLNPDCSVIQPVIEVYTGVRKWFFKKTFETAFGLLQLNVVGLFSKPKVCTVHKKDEDGTIISGNFVVSNPSGDPEIGKELNKLLQANFKELMDKFEETLKEFFISEFHERYVAMGDTLWVNYYGLFDEFLVAEKLRPMGKKEKKKAPKIVKYDESAPSDR